MKKRRREFKRSGKFWVYIVECKDGTYYTGSTNNLEERIKLHNKGRGAKYLRYKLPVKLVYSKEYKYFRNVIAAEKGIKKLLRSQKEELVRIYEKNRII